MTAIFALVACTNVVNRSPEVEFATRTGKFQAGAKDFVTQQMCKNGIIGARLAWSTLFNIETLITGERVRLACGKNQSFRFAACEALVGRITLDQFPAAPNTKHDTAVDATPLANQPTAKQSGRPRLRRNSDRPEYLFDKRDRKS